MGEKKFYLGPKKHSVRVVMECRCGLKMRHLHVLRKKGLTIQTEPPYRMLIQMKAEINDFRAFTPEMEAQGKVIQFGTKEEIKWKRKLGAHTTLR